MTMTTIVRHLALAVPDLRAAESFYRTAFEMKLVGREAVLDDGQWYSLPPGKGWDDATAAGIDLAMVALCKDAFVLALFAGQVAPGRVQFIGLTMEADEIAGVRARLPEETRVRGESPGYLEFGDPYGITWQLSLPGSEFRTVGDWAGRWLEV